MSNDKMVSREEPAAGSACFSLKVDAARCIGCRMCAIVCPEKVFEMIDGKAVVRDPDACTVCGACLRNCPTDAVALKKGGA